MWLMGTAGMLGGCEEIDYLRGEQAAMREIELEGEAVSNPLTRGLAVREQARIASIARHHRRAFPIAALRMLVAGVLVVGAGGTLLGRPSSRRLALQAVAASLVVCGASFVVLAPVRHEAAHAVAEDAVDNVVGVGQGRTRAEVLGEQHAIAMQREQSVAIFEVALYAVAALALTRRRTKEYFAAQSESIANVGS